MPTAYLLTFFLLSSLHHDSTTTGEAITIQKRKNSINHWVLYSLLIVIVELELFCSDFQALRCRCLVLYRHFVRITLFIETAPPEAKLSTCSDITYRDEMKTATAKVRWYNAKHREGMCACFQEVYTKYYRVCVLLELLQMKVYVTIPTFSSFHSM